MKQNLFILIGLNVLVFLLQMGDPSLTMQLALWPPYNSALAQPWQWITHAFLHDSWLHLALNMWAVWVFSPFLMGAYGTQRFILLYAVSAIVGAMVQMLWNVALFYGFGMQSAAFVHYLGASGAVFGLLAAFAVRFPHVPLRLLFFPKDIAARTLIAALIAYECFAQVTGISLFGSGIAHLAHIGGALAGFAIAVLYSKR